jgi:hypothetical protein
MGGSAMGLVERSIGIPFRVNVGRHIDLTPVPGLRSFSRGVSAFERRPPGAGGTAAQVLAFVLHEAVRSPPSASALRS